MSDRFNQIAEAAQRILDAYGQPAPDTVREVYTDGDLNIGREEGVTEIIYRGTLVFRHSPKDTNEENFINDDGEWDEVVERISGDIRKPAAGS